jgi:isoleucyl-tRNA synthetase
MIVADEEARRAIRAQYDVIADELNVKALEFVEREAELVTYRVLPDLKKLGRKLGPDLPRVREALSRLDPNAVARAVRAGQPIAVDGIALQPDEVIVQAMPREGLLVAGEDGIVVGLDTTLTDELIAEGLAREVVRRVNDLRKAAGLNVSDHIVLSYRASERLARAIRAYADYVKRETLSEALTEAPLPEAHTADESFDGEQLTIAIKKV